MWEQVEKLLRTYLDGTLSLDTLGKLIREMRHMLPEEKDRRLSFDMIIRERSKLIRKIKSLEKIVFDKEKTGEAWDIHPGPDVRYKVNLEYLSELCKYMHEKYNNEYVWGENDI